jgi:hypothetical protein
MAVSHQTHFRTSLIMIMLLDPSLGQKHWDLPRNASAGSHFSEQDIDPWQEDLQVLIVGQLVVLQSI